MYGPKPSQLSRFTLKPIKPKTTNLVQIWAELGLIYQLSVSYKWPDSDRTRPALNPNFGFPFSISAKRHLNPFEFIKNLHFAQKENN
jgi:hypothetical protein